MKFFPLWKPRCLNSSRRTIKPHGRAIALWPMNEAEMVALETKVASAAGKTNYQPYRRWMSYRDGDSLSYV